MAITKLSNEARLQCFWIVYFYELEKILNAQKEELLNIKFQSEESNTDEYIKRFLKQIIQENNTIQNCTLEKIVLIENEARITVKLSNFYSFEISEVLLPEELDPQLKSDIAKSKRSVYTNPDLLLKVEGYALTQYESLEIKSTKQNAIPGSSVQQVAPNEWVVFIKRAKESIEVTTGQYINSITEKLPFPDRSPRPQIAFNTLSRWNQKNRVVKEKELIFQVDSIANENKLKLLEDWQDYLAEQWLEVVKAETKKKNEKWFNNALRKFSAKLLRQSANMTHLELKQWINDIENLTE